MFDYSGLKSSLKSPCKANSQKTDAENMWKD